MMHPRQLRARPLRRAVGRPAPGGRWWAWALALALGAWLVTGNEGGALPRAGWLLGATQTAGPPATLPAVPEAAYTLQRDDRAAQGEAPGAALVAGDGGLVRAYVGQRGGPGNGSLYAQRVTNPADEKQWRAWTLISDSDVWRSTPPALAASPDGSHLRLFWADGPALGASVKGSESWDGGRTWSDPAVAHAGLFQVAHLASAGTGDLFLQVEEAPGVWSVEFLRQVGPAAWSAPVRWSLPKYRAMGGIAAAWDPSARLYRLVVSLWVAPTGGGLSLQSLTFDAAGHWSQPSRVGPPDPTSPALESRLPALAYFDGRWRLAYEEVASGRAERPPQVLARTAASADFMHWEPVAAPLPLRATPVWLKAFSACLVVNNALVYRGCGG